MTENARAALVTGGTGRVGGVIAARLEAEGFAVLAAGRRDGDISRPEEARALVERAAKELGGLDLLVNAASDGFEPRPIEEVSEADWDAALDSTAKGSFFVTQAAVPHLRASQPRARRHDRGRRRVPALALLRALTARPRRRRRC